MSYKVANIISTLTVKHVFKIHEINASFYLTRPHYFTVYFQCKPEVKL